MFCGNHLEQGKIEGTETSPGVVMEFPEIEWWQERKKELDRQVQWVFRRWDGILRAWLTVEKVEEGKRTNDPVFWSKIPSWLRDPVGCCIEK